MFARLLAAYCLFHLVGVPAWGSSGEPEIVVYLKGGESQPVRVRDYMKLELGRLMQTAGYRVQWTESRVSTDSFLAVVELREGTGGAALASTASSDGQILPFSWVDCASLTRVLEGALAGETAARRDFLYGRAMARLIAHELYHVLMRSPDHSREGVARPGFRAADLLTEQFGFEESTLAHLRPPTRTVTHDGTFGYPIGRWY